jgi:hypothetical protein
MKKEENRPNFFNKPLPPREVCNICTTRYAGNIRLQKEDGYLLKPCDKCFKRLMKEQRWAQRKKEVSQAVRKEVIDRSGDPIVVLINPEGEKFKVFTQINPQNPAHKEYPGFNKVCATRELADTEFERVVRLIRENKPLTEEKAHENETHDQPAGGAPAGDDRRSRRESLPA